MSLYAMMRTSASGMAAQANRLGTVADNVANSSTTGYKRASVEFSSLILEQATTDYTSGGVTPNVRYAISEQGNLSYTTSTTDLAVSGNGFFLVQSPDDRTVMTRAGAFVLNSNGELVNSAGFKLMGVPTGTAPVANAAAGLEPINVSALGLIATPSENGVLAFNVDAGSAVVTDLPSANAATAQYTSRTSLIAYDNLGNTKTLDVYLSRLTAPAAPGAPSTWEVTVFDRDTATNGTFPYVPSVMSPTVPLATATLTFDANGVLDPAVTSIAVPVPGGSTLTIDMTGSTQLAANYTLLDAEVDGNQASSVDRIEISRTGVMSAIFTNGSQQPVFQIPLATVTSIDKLRPLPGNVFSATEESGDIQVKFAGDAGLGSIISGALESSTVDLAEELTLMIEAQNNYTANSKVFQAGAELVEVLVNLRR